MRGVKSLARSVSELCSSTVVSALRSTNPSLPRHHPLFASPVLALPSSVASADYQCNAAFAISHALAKLSGSVVDTSRDHPKKALSPLDVARLLSDQFPVSSLVHSSIASAPGYLNITLSDEGLSHRLFSAFLQSHSVAPLQTPSRFVTVDFSSPNIAKEMHVGHLRSTIIGDSICRILEFCGHRVSRVNHVGDWGTPFGMLICYLRYSMPDFVARPPSIADLQRGYVAAKQLFEKDERFREQSRQQVVLLQQGDAASLEAWRVICQVSREDFDRIYSRLGVRLEERGESFYRDELGPLVEELLRNGRAQIMDGAVCLVPNGAKFPLILRKSDGGFTYDTTDMAAIRHRVQQGSDWLIYVTDAGQKEHFELIWRSAEECGILCREQPEGASALPPPAPGSPPRVRLDHVGFGLVTGADHKRFASRSESGAVRLMDLLDESARRARELVTTRHANQPNTFTAEELQHISEALGYAAVKYADLSKNYTLNYVFSFDRMLEFNGDTAIYLLYGYARIQSIFRKCGVSLVDLVNRSAPANISFKHPAERGLLLQCVRFHDALEISLSTLSPSALCAYAYALCNKVHAFHEQCRVIGDPLQDQRLLLLYAASLALRQCFELLGIQSVDKM